LVVRLNRIYTKAGDGGDTRLVGGHFPPEIGRQLRILAAEDDTTVQALLEEAINLLLAKKARGRLPAARADV
jgi:cob(I)alamin adenosyltransferase